MHECRKRVCGLVHHGWLSLPPPARLAHACSTALRLPSFSDMHSLLAAPDLPGEAAAALLSTHLVDVLGTLLQCELCLSWVEDTLQREEAEGPVACFSCKRDPTLYPCAAQALVMRDLSLITGDPVKFGLGFVSLFYDVLLMTQHYIIYAPARGAGRAPAHQKARLRSAPPLPDQGAGLHSCCGRACACL